MKYKTVYPENRWGTGVEFEAENDTDATNFVCGLYPSYEEIRAAGNDIAAFIRPMTGSIIVLVRDESE